MSRFRLATEADLPAILSIIGQAQAYLARQGVDQWQDGYPGADVMRDDIRLGYCHVLEHDGRVAGIASLVFDGEPSYGAIYGGAWATPEPYACIHRVALDASLRGRGLSGLLFAAAEDVIRARGVTSVRVDTHRRNLPMRRALLRCGYRVCGVVYLSPGNEERIALEKTLYRLRIENAK